ncbi:molybdenum cofactor synthesis protein 3 / molybdopterin synthase sulphurylase, putative [Babesia bigemina]|uniref:Molybdenum cofactor synthesis protein 3 / molybdopterin synthase sulphurylase, putative n=1 Tax=Babesia bigemina TaxID=5866 RepID=A0A061D7M3_BABBI|nr:molybdenum cofactor synthesis protein 3 / molybdopterin synthase sulphurylase, putative [Babesia bigemina]CDR93720.1 molybdenum cofactor synthesis protein 3 / molybdopterin synthase sulphurylase, putative [Babesia bigemina]|eukprot:XP_012765906.1 molybdenum cofactor synthesis protein 3 / molybdopterin synthase sulphurylase, putative [Babesia bigemina]
MTVHVFDERVMSDTCVTELAECCLTSGLMGGAAVHVARGGNDSDSCNTDSTVEVCRKRAEEINRTCPPTNGCLGAGKRNVQRATPEETLLFRVPWAPLRRHKTRISSLCTSTEMPFCTALSQQEAERLVPQFVALQQCTSPAQGEYAVDSTTTCAVLVVGAGGLGSPLLMYLAAGGIGIIGVMDGDVVETSNLHRYWEQRRHLSIWQIVHDEEHQGINKALSAVTRMRKINSRGTYVAYERFCGEDEAENIIPQYDIIVDATDNPQSRYLINDACVKYSKTLVIASAIGTQGQLMVLNRVVDAHLTPCFRCVCPLEGNTSIPARRGACSTAGVLGSIPGVLGCLQVNADIQEWKYTSMQATEVLKLAAGADDAVLAPGRMLMYDTTNVTKPFRCIQLSKNPNFCGDGAGPIRIKMVPWETCKINQLTDDIAISNDDFWNIYMRHAHKGVPVKLSCCLSGRKTTDSWQGEPCTVCLVDVRPREHYELCHITGAAHWALDNLVDEFAVLESRHAEAATEESLRDIEELIESKCIGGKIEGNLLILFICFLGNSSRTATMTSDANYFWHRNAISLKMVT